MPSFLYIEDDSLSRQVLTIILTMQMGYEDVIVFEDSTDYAARIAALPFVPDVVFLDIHMRPHTGTEILVHLRMMPQYANTRVVALTASVMNEEVEMLRTAGFDGVIGKPINHATFPDLLMRILKGEKIWNPA